MVLNEGQRQTLRAICEAFLPSLQDTATIQQITERDGKNRELSGRSFDAERRTEVEAWCRRSVHAHIHTCTHTHTHTHTYTRTHTHTQVGH
jgi:hypothetical protein